MEGEPTVEKSLGLNNSLEGCSKLSTFDGSSPVTSVYKRRKFLTEPSTCFLSRVTSIESSEDKGFVYQRRKPHSYGKSIFPIRVSENTKQNDQSDAGACATLLKTENPFLNVEKLASHEARNESEAARSSVSAVCRNEPAAKDDRDRIVERQSYDDGCCSSSTVNMNAEAGTLEPDMDEYSECSSSGAFNEDAVGHYESEKDLCVSILRKQGLLSSAEPNRSFDSGKEEAASCSAVSLSLSCNICRHPGSAGKMLICDHCEDAFHVSCCNRPKREIDNDEWFCLSCFEQKHNSMKKATQRRSTSIF